MTVAPMWWAQYCGLPFVYNGRDRAGLDCWGLVRLVYADRAGIALPSYGEVEASKLARVHTQMGRDALLPPWRKAEGPPRAFDVVLMLARFDDGTGRRRALPVHVGVMLGAREVLHIEEGCNSVVENLDAPLIVPRIVRSYRHEALA